MPKWKVKFTTGSNLVATEEAATRDEAINKAYEALEMDFGRDLMRDCEFLSAELIKEGESDARPRD
jgi:hypothetical protein